MPLKICQSSARLYAPLVNIYDMLRARVMCARAQARVLGIQSRSEVGWSVSKSRGLVCPSFADVLTRLTTARSGGRARTY